MNLPFKEIKKSKNSVVRTFSKDLEENELKWHYDLEDRMIYPLNDNDWFFQRDNQLPIKINSPLFIKAKEWHRIIKGKSDLIIEVFFV